MKRSTELILGELTKHLGRKHLNSELEEIANDLTEILERNNELKQCNIANVVVPKGTLCRNCGSDDIYTCFLTDVKVCNKCHYQD